MVMEFRSGVKEKQDPAKPLRPKVPGGCRANGSTVGEGQAESGLIVRLQQPRSRRGSLTPRNAMSGHRCSLGFGRGDLRIGVDRVRRVILRAIDWHPDTHNGAQSLDGTHFHRPAMQFGQAP